MLKEDLEDEALVPTFLQELKEFLRLSPEEEGELARDVLKHLGVNTAIQRQRLPWARLPSRTSEGKLIPVSTSYKGLHEDDFVKAIKVGMVCPRWRDYVNLASV